MRTATEAHLLEMFEPEGHSDSSVTLFLKPTNGDASEGQKAGLNVKEAAEYLGKEYIAQENFTEHETIGFNFLAIDGKLIDFVVVTVEGGISEESYHHGFPNLNL